MRTGATPLEPALQPTAQPPAGPAGPPPGPRSAGLAPATPLLPRAPRVRPAQGVRRVVDLEASTVLELHPADAVVAVAGVDESAVSIQDRIRLRALEAAARG